jgi:hypothetical protein
MDAVKQMDDTANKYGRISTGEKGRLLIQNGKQKPLFDDDLVTQALFADELDSVFGPTARTSFQGQIDQALKRGVSAATTTGGAADAAIGVIGKAAEKARGINQENAFKSIKELLRDKQ